MRSSPRPPRRGTRPAAQNARVLPRVRAPTRRRPPPRRRRAAARRFQAGPALPFATRRSSAKYDCHSCASRAPWRVKMEKLPAAIAVGRRNQPNETGITAAQAPNLRHQQDGDAAPGEGETAVTIAARTRSSVPHAPGRSGRLRISSCYRAAERVSRVANRRCSLSRGHRLRGARHCRRRRRATRLHAGAVPGAAATAGDELAAIAAAVERWLLDRDDAASRRDRPCGGEGRPAPTGPPAGSRWRPAAVGVAAPPCATARVHVVARAPPRAPERGEPAERRAPARVPRPPGAKGRGATVRGPPVATIGPSLAKHLGARRTSERHRRVLTRGPCPPMHDLLGGAAIRCVLDADLRRRRPQRWRSARAARPAGSSTVARGVADSVVVLARQHPPGQTFFVAVPREHAGQPVAEREGVRAADRC